MSDKRSGFHKARKKLFNGLTYLNPMKYVADWAVEHYTKNIEKDIPRYQERYRQKLRDEYGERFPQIVNDPALLRHLNETIADDIRGRKNITKETIIREPLEWSTKTILITVGLAAAVGIAITAASGGTLAPIAIAISAVTVVVTQFALAALRLNGQVKASLRGGAERGYENFLRKHHFPIKDDPHTRHHQPTRHVPAPAAERLQGEKNFIPYQKPEPAPLSRPQEIQQTAEAQQWLAGQGRQWLNELEQEVQQVHQRAVAGIRFANPIQWLNVKTDAGREHAWALPSGRAVRWGSYENEAGVRFYEAKVRRAADVETIREELKQLHFRTHKDIEITESKDSAGLPIWRVLVREESLRDILDGTAVQKVQAAHNRLDWQARDGAVQFKGESSNLVIGKFTQKLREHNLSKAKDGNPGDYHVDKASNTLQIKPHAVVRETGRVAR